MVDLKALIGQYNPGMILVGPVLNGSGDRYFEIAGNGRKIYRRVDIGTIPATEAERQRAQVVTQLEDHFIGVLSFASPREMAYAVHERWANDETAKVLMCLTSDGLATELQPTTPTSPAMYQPHPSIVPTATQPVLPEISQARRGIAPLGPDL